MVESEDRGTPVDVSTAATKRPVLARVFRRGCLVLLFVGVSFLLAASLLPRWIPTAPAIWGSGLLNAGRVMMLLGLWGILPPFRKKPAIHVPELARNFRLGEALALVLVMTLVTAMVARSAPHPSAILTVFVLQALCCLPGVYMEFRHRRYHAESSALRRWVFLGLAYLFLPALIATGVSGTIAVLSILDSRWEVSLVALGGLVLSLAVVIPYVRGRWEGV